MQAIRTLTRPARPAQFTIPAWWPALSLVVLLTALLGWAALLGEAGPGRPVVLAEPGALERELVGLPVPGNFTLDTHMDSDTSGLGGAHAWARAEWRGPAAPAAVIAELGPALARDGWALEESTWGVPSLTGIQLASLRRDRTTLRLSVVRAPDAAETRLAALIER